MGPMETWMKALGTPDITPELNQTVADAVRGRGERGCDGAPQQSREGWSLTFALNDIENTTRRLVHEYENFNTDQRRN